MKLFGSFFKGGTVLGVTQVTGQLCSLGRNIIIARLISPSNFGIASIFLMIINFLEMISNLSLDRLLVQAKDGNDADFQNVAHFLLTMRGALCFLILLFLAKPFALLFSIPDTTFAFYAIAFIPLLNGFLNLDPKRVQRDMRFWPYASIDLSSQLIMLLFAWPLGKWFGDYRAMIFLFFIKALVLVTGSHFTADRKYAWSTNKKYINRFVSFGWPLLFNGILMFGILQGDRFFLGSSQKLFGSFYNMADVGYFSSAISITMMPAIMCINITSTLLLPILSNVQGKTQYFLKQSILFAQGITILALSFSILLIFIGDKVLIFIYGEQYENAGRIVGWLGIMWSINIIRLLPSNISMAKGNTKILLYATIIRSLALAGVLIVIFFNMDLIWLPIVGTIGEISAYLISLFLNKKILNIPLKPFLGSNLIFIFFLAISLLIKVYILRYLFGFQLFVFVFIFLITILFLTVIFSPAIKIEIKKLVSLHGVYPNESNPG